MTTMLVTGGTGRLGRAVVRAVAESGARARVLSRNAGEGGGGVEWAVGDLSTGAGVAAAVRGVHAIVHCATTNGARDVEMMRRLVEAARGEGSPHVVYVSIVGVDRIPLPYYRAKLAAERLLEDSGVPWTVLRATQFHELVLWMTSVQRRWPVVFAPGGGVSLQPVAVRDVADRLVALAWGDPVGRAPDCGGPEVLRASELARSVVREWGRRRAVVRLPGRTFAALRQGHNLTLHRGDDRGTWEGFLAERRAAGRGGRVG